MQSKRVAQRRSCLHQSGQVWDLGGQTSIRPYWRCYYPNTDAIIFVVDSADVERLAIAKQELSAMLEVRHSDTQTRTHAI